MPSLGRVCLSGKSCRNQDYGLECRGMRLKVVELNGCRQHMLHAMTGVLLNVVCTSPNLCASAGMQTMRFCVGGDAWVADSFP